MMLTKLDSSLLEKKIVLVGLFFCCGGFMLDIAAAQTNDLVELRRSIDQLHPLHHPIRTAKLGDWLSMNREPGQTFDEYLNSKPVGMTSERNTLYIQPIGSFSGKQQQIVKFSQEYMACFFNLPVEIKKAMSTASIPDHAKRLRSLWGDQQILTTYVLDEVLKPMLPSNAVAIIAFSSEDLWPGEGWNFVFGQASLKDRVGIWSLCRNGDPEESDASFRLSLMRTLKTAVHETGHMFSIYHCIAYACVMNGSNHMGESDAHPLYLCPECHAKICWATGADPIKRYHQLATFCETYGFASESAFFKRSSSRLKTKLVPDNAMSDDLIFGVSPNGIY